MMRRKPAATGRDDPSATTLECGAALERGAVRYKTKRKRPISSLVIAVAAGALVVASHAGAASAPAPPPASAKARAENCLDQAAVADKESRFQDVADGYLCAAEEATKIPDPVRAARFRGLSHLARAWDFYTRGVTGTAGRANLGEALRQVELAVSFLGRPGALPGLDRLAEGWRAFLTGTKAGLDGRHAESRKQFETARALAIELSTSIPPLRSKADRLLSLAQDQIDWALVSELLQDPEGFLDRGGEINQRLAELRERAEGDTKRWYEGLQHFYEGRRRFEEASIRLESWDYQQAFSLLDRTAKAFDASRTALAGIPRQTRKEQFSVLVDGLAKATEAETHHAKALEALLAKGDPTTARRELADGVNGYRDAQAAFEKAGHSAASIAAIRGTSRRLGERAAAMERAFSVKRILFGVGGIFVAIFLGALGLLTVLQSRLGIDGRLVVTIALVVGIIGAFGLESPKIFAAAGKLLGK